MRSEAIARSLDLHKGRPKLRNCANQLHHRAATTGAPAAAAPATVARATVGAQQMAAGLLDIAEIELRVCTSARDRPAAIVGRIRNGRARDGDRSPLLLEVADKETPLPAAQTPLPAAQTALAAQEDLDRVRVVRIRGLALEEGVDGLRRAAQCAQRLVLVSAQRSVLEPAQRHHHWRRRRPALEPDIHRPLRTVGTSRPLCSTSSATCHAAAAASRAAAACRAAAVSTIAEEEQVGQPREGAVARHDAQDLGEPASAHTERDRLQVGELGRAARRALVPVDPPAPQPPLRAKGLLDDRCELSRRRAREHREPRLDELSARLENLGGGVGGGGRVTNGKHRGATCGKVGWGTWGRRIGSK